MVIFNKYIKDNATSIYNINIFKKYVENIVTSALIFKKYIKDNASKKHYRNLVTSMYV